MTISLGIFYHEHNQQGEPFSLETLHFRQLCEMGQVRGMQVFVFCPEDLDHDRCLINGFAPDTRGRWGRHTYPLPEVIYLRGVTMDQGSDQRMMAESIWLQSQGVRMLNSLDLVNALGDKWRTYELLSLHPAISPHLPETTPFALATLKEMLGRYPVVMVKHRFGFESRGMIRIARDNEGRYSCVVNDLDATRQRFAVSNITELAELLLRYTQPSGDYIVQQGIKLAKAQERSFELRIILNKVRGSWLRTGMVVRLAGSADLPFLAVGSERNQRPSEILPTVFGSRSEEILEQVRSLARIMVVELDRAAGPGGELALDIGFDEDGHPWLIEGNSKPFNLFIRTGSYSLRRKNMARVLDYALQMAENDPTKQESSLRDTK